MQWLSSDKGAKCDVWILGRRLSKCMWLWNCRCANDFEQQFSIITIIIIIINTFIITIIIMFFNYFLVLDVSESLWWTFAQAWTAHLSRTAG